MGPLVSGAAAVISGLFALALVRRYLVRGTRALKFWSTSLAMFCLATIALTVGEVFGWNSAWFRTYYLFGGVLTVPWLALGTVAVSARDRVTIRVLGVTALVVASAFVAPALTASEPELFVTGIAFSALWGLLLLTTREEAAVAGSLALVATFSAAATFAVVAGAIDGTVPETGLPEGSELFAPIVRSFAVGGNAIGAILVIVGAATAAVRLRGQGAPQRVVGNLLIGLGVLVASSGGLFAFLGDTESHAIAFAVGVAVMYAGFVRTTATVPGVAGAVPVGPGAPAGDRSGAGSERHVVEVYTREDCGLCERAEQLAKEEAAGAVVHLVDVDADPELQRRYHVRVPVVAVDGVEIAEGQVEPGQIRDALRRAEAR